MSVTALGHARDIQGIDPTYEQSRRAYGCLNKILIDLHTVIKRKKYDEFLDLAEKLQAALSMSSNYILGHFPYNVSFNSKCRNHCLNLHCSNPKDDFQREQCKDTSPDCHDEKYDCTFCNLLPGIVAHLERLVDELKNDLEDITYREMKYDIKKSLDEINLYKKQVMRNTITSTTWEEKYRECSRSLDLITADFAMKFLPRKARETQVSVI